MSIGVCKGAKKSSVAASHRLNIVSRVRRAPQKFLLHRFNEGLILGSLPAWGKLETVNATIFVDGSGPAMVLRGDAAA
jgi:hypothetical protein